MKTIIAGGRHHKFSQADRDALDAFHRNHQVTEVVSGGASGADAEGETWAKAHGIPIKRFPADWNTHGRAAGPIRNKQMAEYADAVVLFPGGRGTASMKSLAHTYGLNPIREVHNP